MSCGIRPYSGRGRGARRSVRSRRRALAARAERRDHVVHEIAAVSEPRQTPTLDRAFALSEPRYELLLRQEIEFADVLQPFLRRLLTRHARARTLRYPGRGS